MLGVDAHSALADEDNASLVFAISTLEIARLTSAERITLAGRQQTWIAESHSALLAETAPLTHEIAIPAYELPGEFPPNPAGQMLVATAMVGDMSLVTADHDILAYPHVESIDARV